MPFTSTCDISLIMKRLRRSDGSREISRSCCSGPRQNTRSILRLIGTNYPAQNGTLGVLGDGSILGTRRLCPGSEPASIWVAH